VKYSKALKRYRAAFLSIKEELIILIITTSFVIYISAVGIYYFENDAQPEIFKSIFHSLWWAVATLTTVGYGDIYPVTVGGKIFTYVILMVGLCILAVPAGLLASAMLNNGGKTKDRPRR
jgi:voltage-gated potassium channel